MSIDESQRQLLRKVARWSIQNGLLHGRVLPVDLADYPVELQQPGATFVTLKRDGSLRGCIGSLEAARPLVIDVVHNAFNAAFRDPRFAPLRTSEMHDLELHLSVLSAPEAFPVADEADLLARLRPGVDGLILAEGHRRGTFLPSVWEQLPEPLDFVTHLKRKAGLPVNHWSPTMRVERYTVEAF